VDIGEFARCSLALWGPIGPALHRAMEPSIEEARQYLENRKFDAYVFADLTRYHAVCRLETAALPDSIGFQRLQNNGIGFTCGESALRVWKADEDGELRGPGTSKSKREYFDQEFLLFPPEPSQARYVIIWDYDFTMGLLSLSLTCPKNFDVYKPWNYPQCHFLLPLPHAATSIVPSSDFSEVSTDEDIVLEPKLKTADLDEHNDDD
jgi:hypothetical protein